jgi:predicted PurR-regulated permease PerM
MRDFWLPGGATKERAMGAMGRRKAPVAILTLFVSILMGGATSATIIVSGFPWQGAVPQTFEIYVKGEVDDKISGVTNQLNQLNSQFATQLSQLAAKTAQDQAKLKSDLQSDLTNQIGNVLTPSLLTQIQDAAATEATNRVLSTLRAQGVIQ